MRPILPCKQDYDCRVQAMTREIGLNVRIISVVCLLVDDIPEGRSLLCARSNRCLFEIRVETQQQIIAGLVGT